MQKMKSLNTIKSKYEDAGLCIVFCIHPELKQMLYKVFRSMSRVTIIHCHSDLDELCISQ